MTSSARPIIRSLLRCRESDEEAHLDHICQVADDHADEHIGRVKLPHRGASQVATHVVVASDAYEINRFRHDFSCSRLS